MTLPTGTRLGPYDVRSLLGVGGMGEVYLAWDARLNREVAVKVLPLEAACDPGRLRRFEQEARAVGALNHPNVVAVHDVGSHEGLPYMVTERLEGKTLRACLDAADLTPRKAIEYAVQVAHGLAAAHARGIVHRDLKPENVFVCRDGVVKILDFGVAKLFADTGAGGLEDATARALTLPGTIVGTAAYMSPEQVRGLAVDARSDIFALGVVLYEMLARQRPFDGETMAEVQTAILRQEPRELSAIDSRVSNSIDRIIRRCLEKRPEDRFDTARDVALSLEAAAGATAELPAAAAITRRPRLRGAAIAVGSLLAGVALTAALLGLLRPTTPPPTYTQLTFRRGLITSAHFAPDGETVVYSAAWDGQPTRVFTTRIGSNESRELGINGMVWAMASNGEMAVALGHNRGRPGPFKLARASLAGGAPRELLDDVLAADWDPNGQDLAVVREVGGWSQVEYPIGHVLYRTSELVHSLRVLPDRRVAIFERVTNGGARRFAISLLSKEGSRKVLTSGWTDWWPLGWAPSGEVFFSGSMGGEYALHAVTPAGKERVVARVPGDFLLYDVDARGRILVGRNFPRGGVIALAPGETQERDLSWRDFSSAADLSADGRQLLLGEIGGGLGEKGGIALRRTDGSPAVMLGEGTALSLSADGRFVLALPDVQGSGDRLVVIPAGAGERRELRHPSIPRFFNAAWFGDGRHVAILGGEGAERLRVYVWDIDGVAPPRPISPEGGFESVVVAPDGRWVAAAGRRLPPMLYPVDGGPPRPLPGGRDNDRPLRWTADGRWLFVRSGDLAAVRIERVVVATGARQLFKELRPADPAGVFGITSVVITPDGTSYAYTFSSALGSLYLAEGIR